MVIIDGSYGKISKRKKSDDRNKPDRIVNRSLF
jgi:hypothetical protein